METMKYFSIQLDEKSIKFIAYNIPHGKPLVKKLLPRVRVKILMRLNISNGDKYR